MNENTRRHTVSLTDRALLTVTAVDEVLSFDETLVNLDIGGTMLSVSGRELSVTKLMLESGEVCIKGQRFFARVQVTDGDVLRASFPAALAVARPGRVPRRGL